MFFVDLTPHLLAHICIHVYLYKGRQIFKGVQILHVNANTYLRKITPGVNLHDQSGRCKCIIARVNLHGMYFTNVNAHFLNTHGHLSNILKTSSRLPHHLFKQNKHVYV